MKTYPDLLDEWLDLHSLEISESSTYEYNVICNVLKEVYADKLLENISSSDIQNFFRCKRHLSRNTIIQYSKVFHMSFEYAIRREYISENPYSGIIIPAGKEPKEIYPFTAEEVSLILKQPMKPWLYRAIILSFKTGMRKGEIFALKWDDIDLKKGIIRVSRTQARASAGLILNRPKTSRSRRSVDIDSDLILMLRKMKAESNSVFVFSNKDGGMMYPTSLSSCIKRKCKKAGIRPHTFHDLRHGHATYLLEKNVHPKIVQSRLGHASITMTLDTYSHIISGMQAPAVSAMEQFII